MAATDPYPYDYRYGYVLIYSLLCGVFAGVALRYPDAEIPRILAGICLLFAIVTLAWILAPAAWAELREDGRAREEVRPAALQEVPADLQARAIRDARHLATLHDRAGLERMALDYLGRGRLGVPLTLLLLDTYRDAIDRWAIVSIDATTWETGGVAALRVPHLEVTRRLVYATAPVSAVIAVVAGEHVWEVEPARLVDLGVRIPHGVLYLHPDEKVSAGRTLRDSTLAAIFPDVATAQRT